MSTLAKARSHPRSPASCLAEPPPRTRVTDGTTGPSVLLDHCAEARPRPCFWCSSRPSRPEPVPPGPRSRLRRGSACRRCPRCAVVDTHAARLAAPASRLSRRGARGLNYRFGHAVEVKAFGERGGRPRTPRRGTTSRQRPLMAMISYAGCRTVLTRRRVPTVSQRDLLGSGMAPGRLNVTFSGGGALLAVSSVTARATRVGVVNRTVGC